MTYTNYNELMRKALLIAARQGAKEQHELDAIVNQVFSNDKHKTKEQLKQEIANI